MTTTSTNLDADVELYLHLADQIAQLTEQQRAIKARIAALGVGEYPCTKAKVVVQAPRRVFEVDTAWRMLTPEQQAVCVSPDAKKIKAQLPPALADACMKPGSGDPVVVVKP